MRSRELGDTTFDLPRSWPLRIRVNKSPMGIGNRHGPVSPYQLALVMPGIWPKFAKSRSAMRDSLTLR